MLMSNDLASFLGSSPVFSDLKPDQLTYLAGLVRQERFPAGSVILCQGAKSDAVYFVRSGQLAVRIQRGGQSGGYRETVAYLNPPDLFGELSFLTGKACVADVEVVVDADIVILPREAVPQIPGERESLLRSLTRVIATRLQDTVTGGAKVREAPVVLLINSRNWPAPHSFSWEFGRSLAEQTGQKTLLVNLGADEEKAIHDVSPLFAVVSVATQPTGEMLRTDLARLLTEWKRNFQNVILNSLGKDGAQAVESTSQFANWIGFLLGPGDPVPNDLGPHRFVVQTAEGAQIATLSGNRQLILHAEQSESEHRAGRAVLPKFLRTAESLARCVSGQQVGLALGGGAAWGWAHVGVLRVLRDAGLPIDVISGCSMGSVIGAFYGAGFDIDQLTEIAEYWRTRTRRFINKRIWRLHLLNEGVLEKAFRQYFHDRELNQVEVPYWANAVDIRTGKEYTIQSGTLVACLRASIALPGLLPPSAREPHLLVDAGIMNPVPVELIRKMGCHFAIGVNAMAALESQPVGDKYPSNALDVMHRCMFLMGHEIGQARAEKIANVLFTPSLGNITMLQFSRSPEIIECGRRAAEAQLPIILDRYEQLKAGSSSTRAAEHPMLAAK